MMINQARKMELIFQITRQAIIFFYALPDYRNTLKTTSKIHRRGMKRVLPLNIVVERFSEASLGSFLGR